MRRVAFDMSGPEKAVCVPDRPTSNYSFCAPVLIPVFILRTCIAHVRALGAPAEWAVYELKGVLDAPKISFIMCNRLSDEVGTLIYIHRQQLSFSPSISWPSIVCRSISLASIHYSSSGPENQIIRFYFSPSADSFGRLRRF